MKAQVNAPTPHEVFIEVVAGEAMTAADLGHARDEVVEIGTSENLWDILVDASAVDEPASNLHIYTLVAELLELESARHLRIALVASPEPTAGASTRFTDTVAVNRGLVSRVFTSRAEAIDWLAQR